MVRVIEQRSEAGDDACIEFRVYPKPTDPEVVLGDMMFAEDVAPRAAAITVSPLGMGVKEVFLATLEYANQRGIPAVWVNDPYNLFPLAKRSVREFDHETRYGFGQNHSA